MKKRIKETIVISRSGVEHLTHILQHWLGVTYAVTNCGRTVRPPLEGKSSNNPKRCPRCYSEALQKGRSA